MKRLPRYLYLSGDAPFVIEDEPTSEDLITAVHGVIRIVRLADGCAYQRDDEWAPAGSDIEFPNGIERLPWGVLVGEDEREHGPHHVHPGS